jgi:hypothetical protein
MESNRTGQTHGRTSATRADVSESALVRVHPRPKSVGDLVPVSRAFSSEGSGFRASAYVREVFDVGRDKGSKRPHFLHPIKHAE